MKEYIGEDFRTPYCEALANGDVEWEFFCITWTAGKGLPVFSSGIPFRFKPAPRRTIDMYDAQGKLYQLVAPELEAPEIDTGVFYVMAGGSSSAYYWQGIVSDQIALANGNIFLTREDAQAMADFQRKQRLGEV